MLNVIIQDWWAEGSGDGLSCDTSRGSWDRKVRVESRTMIALLELDPFSSR